MFHTVQNKKKTKRVPKPKPAPLPHSWYLSRRDEITLHYPPKAQGSLTGSWHDIQYNTQVQRFILLMFLLKNSDLCQPEIQSFLSKYIRTLSDADLQQLRLHLPNGLARKRGLGADPPVIYLARAYFRAMLHLQADPASFYHVESGWFLSLAAKLAQRSVFVKQPNSTAKVFSHKESKFWFGELENAVFLGIMCRLLSLVSAEDPFIYKKHWLSIEEAWRVFFGTFNPPSNHSGKKSNNNRACTCWDKGRYALPHEEFFFTIKPALMSTQYSGKEVTLLKVLDTIDALPSSGNFKLGDLYTARVNTAWHVKKRVFENLYFTPTLLQIIEEDLPKLTLQKILQCAEWNVTNHGFSAFDRKTGVTEEEKRGARNMDWREINTLLVGV
ncbi:hypothetical protein QBC37DRAFT_446818 [Rhypophila decipiens]|uniref:Uncharacterized protein n=1 Tax=Rhypophila decipiens TaxID=261697 RepID=A0AAN6Y4I9_9PEZI|nr:hypothetical protein QBC37DRAFT_446818 [Rhypophila decipiens]